ncbi:hypothetical protein EYW49_15025 [Siculibacillus lacustris]|uniref:Uncharacterized protein n=1 Tax=Siculibacillus lacustris TaxID=1549641 RepID=A0A4V2KT65_9HYPH|nr:hypothetical protein [Siculibacillus lacustris]TBW35926.1 hypothetical protein EYW49_15025 [Siculibacillus lacustris]
MPVESLVTVAIGKSLFSFGLMAVIAMLSAVFIHALVAGLGAVKRRAERRAAPLPVPAVATPKPCVAGIDPAVVAAIAAAVHATLGARHRIVYIGDTAQPSSWTAETRARQHGSHDPHREH